MLNTYTHSKSIQKNAKRVVKRNGASIIHPFQRRFIRSSVTAFRLRAKTQDDKRCYSMKKIRFLSSSSNNWNDPVMIEGKSKGEHRSRRRRGYFHKWIALLLCLAIMLSSAVLPTMALTAEAETGSTGITKGDLEARNDALHFYIRHWHTSDPGSTEFNDPVLDDASDSYFMFVDGYIVPKTNEGYDLYLIDHNDSESSESDRPARKVTETVSDYIEHFDSKTGKVDLKALPVVDKDTGKPQETFAGFTVSAGQTSVEMNEETISITYSPNVHLVKGHVFYISNILTKLGTNDETIFPQDTSTGLMINPEIDTMELYVYSHDSEDDDAYKEGDIVKKENGDFLQKSDVELTDMKLAQIKSANEGESDETIAKAIEAERKDKFEKIELEYDGITLEDIELVKFYSTTEGLHTDKTATAWDDGRTFDLELDAWYSQGQAPDVGIVLDASGSMGFAADIPTPIRVTAENYGQDIVDQLESYFGNYEEGFSATDSFMTDHLKGYYEFRQNDGTNRDTYRLWYFNSANEKNYKYTDFNSTSYFNGKNDVFAKAAKRVSLSNGQIDFSTTTDGVTNPSDFQSVFGSEYDYKGWGATGAPAKFSATSGFSLSAETAKSAFVPEVQPEDGNFTLSFTLRQDSDFSSNKRFEILYVGPQTGNIDDDNYFHMYREGKSVYACMGQDETPLFTFSTDFSNGVARRITLVFNKGTVAAYMDGVYQGSEKASIGGQTVVFAPFEMNHSDRNDSYLSVDSLFLFDTALNAKQISALLTVALDAGIEAVQSVNTVDAFLAPAEIDLLLDKHNNDNSKLGVAGYSYFVYDPRSGTAEYTPLGYYYGNSTDVVTPSPNAGAGWYYSSFNQWPNGAGMADDVTAKVLRGIAANSGFTDTITAGATAAETSKGAAPDVGSNDKEFPDIDPESGNTGKTYSASVNSPTKFYIDSDGYLRCFFSTSGTSDANHYTSYVYALTDEQYVKKESLQRAMGAFVTKLLEKSSTSRVSAVRFSNSTYTGENLLLLDWTNNPVTAQKAMSLQWNGGTASDSVKKRIQYNYIITGGTYPSKGLNAYTDLLDKDLRDEDYLGDNYENTPKYLILFTDGVPNGGDTEQDAAKKATDTLKGKGYTIFTVLLTGGPVEYTGESYKNAREFLLGLSGSKDTADDDKENYFYATDYKEMSRYSGVTETMDKTDMLVYAFAQQIVKKITKDQTDYTVQDYIDPRFDLLDADGSVLHLDANGKVHNDAGNVIADLANGAGYELRFSGSKNNATNKPNPYLRYDSTKDMYYLIWTNQTIPGYVVGAEKLSVWDARFTIRAKEDFVGGNDILTNGNQELMNLVYPGSLDLTSGNVSSGTDKATGSNVSKGFPRVKVNVATQQLDIGQSETRVYLGEIISPAKLIKNLGETVGNDYYWADYFTRYAKAHHSDETDGMDRDELLEYMLQKLIDDPSSWGLDIPYYYLPNEAGTNQAGLADQQPADELGVLHYRWDRLDPDTGNPIDEHDYANEPDKEPEDSTTGPFKGTDYQTMDTRRILYRLTVSYWPYPDATDDFWQILKEWMPEEEELQGFMDDMYDLLEGTDGLSARLQRATTSADMTNILASLTAIETEMTNVGVPEQLRESGEFDRLLNEIRYKLLMEKQQVVVTHEGTDGMTETTIEYTGLSGLLDELAKAKANTADQSAYIALENERFNKRNEIDNLISQAANYIDYLRWCYGYGEKVTDADDNVIQDWGQDKKFSMRDTENGDLIHDVERTDKDGNKISGDYAYSTHTSAADNEIHSASKDPVGVTQYNKAVIGMHTTRVVRGELAFEMEFCMVDLEYLFSEAWKSKTNGVPYTVNLNRKENGTEDTEWYLDIPDLTITITPRDIELLNDTYNIREADWVEVQVGTNNATIYVKDGETIGIRDDGAVILYYNAVELQSDGTTSWINSDQYPKAIYYPKGIKNASEEYDIAPGTVIFYSDPTVFDPVYDGYESNSDYARGLPYGTYTLTPDTDANKEAGWYDAFNFGDEPLDGIAYAAQTEYTFDDWHLTRTTNMGEPNNSVESIYFPRSGRSQNLGQLGRVYAYESNRTAFDSSDIRDGAGRITERGALVNGKTGVVFQLGTHKYSGTYYDADGKPVYIPRGTTNYTGDLYDGDGNKLSDDQKKAALLAGTEYSLAGIPQYTDDRVGMAVLTASLKYELPDTGAAGTTVLFVAGASLLLVGCLVAFLYWITERKKKVNSAL